MSDNICAWATGNPKESCDMVTGLNARIAEVEATVTERNVLMLESQLLKDRITELEKENYDLQHSITEAIDPRRGDVKKGSES
jgi:hypothetical protein